MMTKFAEIVAGQPMALCQAYGRGLLEQDWPAASEPDRNLLAVDIAAGLLAMGAEITVGRGERYVVARGLAVVPVRGLLTPAGARFESMGWATYHGIAETMAQLDADEDVRGIVMEFDSPGGMVLGISAAARAIAQTAKPVHGLVHPLAASACYWLASQCDDLTMTEGSEMGSIGVMIGTSDPVQPAMFDGWQDTALRSAHARAKNADATTEEGRANLQNRLDQAEAEFHAAIAAGRDIPEGELADRLSLTDDPRDGGAAFTGIEAVSRGLADVAGADRMAFYAAMAETYAPAQGSGARAFGARAQAQAAKARAAI